MKHCLHFYTIIFGLFLFCSAAKAQYVTIPDSTFVNWLTSNGYAGCMNGNQLDTTCGAVLGATAMTFNRTDIHDLTGIQYFKSLDSLDCSNGQITNIPALPPALDTLNCSRNKLTALPALPHTLKVLDCSYNLITALPPLPSTLDTLLCDDNLLTNLPTLPSSLKYLHCPFNPLTNLPPLPPSLYMLYCEFDSIVSLPTLPASLYVLYCDYNKLTVLPALPASLGELTCGGNQLTTLPALPSTIYYLTCPYNQLTSLPALPYSLAVLLCWDNQLTTIPALPAIMWDLECQHNQITSLPALRDLSTLYCDSNLLTNLPDLPPSLTSLYCNNNHLTNLPPLPSGLNYFYCGYNQLTSLPALPDYMSALDCSFNTALTCLPELKQILNLNFAGTAVTCLPDYGVITNSSPSLDSTPLCGIYNLSGCQPFWNISGQVYYDRNDDCVFDSTDASMNYVKIELYNNGALLQQTFAGGEGYYSFDSIPYGNYTVQVDTISLPFTVACPDTSYYSVSLSATDTFSYNNNFAMGCRSQGFDIGAQATINIGIPRPNAVFALNTIAGDISELYGAHCAAGISGQVQLTYSGQLSYTGLANGALTPTTISSNIISWTIADYGTVNDLTAFNLLFKIDSLATLGSLVCFNITVTPTNGDYNPSNNILNYCFPVVDAIDPNEKEVSPSGNTDTPNHWLTYTIRFQNTGSAPAQNIRITDTLDSNLDASTFQLLSYSAKNLTQVIGNDVVFNFPNINLPDSLTSDSASRGYIQYKIKLKDNLPLGTQIQNTADIYFDLNPAVVTNTTLNTIATPTSIGQVADMLTMQLYPNPAKNYVIVQTDGNAIGGTLQITDITGRVVYNSIINNSTFRIPTSALTGGVYMVKVNDLNGRYGVGKLVVE